MTTLSHGANKMLSFISSGFAAGCCLVQLNSSVVQCPWRCSLWKTDQCKHTISGSSSLLLWFVRGAIIAQLYWYGRVNTRSKRRNALRSFPDCLIPIFLALLVLQYMLFNHISQLAMVRWVEMQILQCNDKSICIRNPLNCKAGRTSSASSSGLRTFKYWTCIISKILPLKHFEIEYEPINWILLQTQNMDTNLYCSRSPQSDESGVALCC